MSNDDHRERIEITWRYVCGHTGLGQHGFDAFDFIAGQYSNPLRRYHNLAHIGFCLDMAQWYADERGLASDPTVLGALILHDVIYDPRSKRNEEDSAAYAQSLGSSEVARMILATKTHRPAGALDNLVIDCDLASLGRPWEAFARDSEAIREEYSFVPDELWRTGRASVLRTFLSRSNIYQTETFRRVFEAAARENLERAIGELGAHS